MLVTMLVTDVGVKNVGDMIRIPTVKLKIPEKLFLKSDPELLLHSSYSFNLSYLQVIAVAYLLNPNRYDW